MRLQPSACVLPVSQPSINAVLAKAEQQQSMVGGFGNEAPAIKLCSMPCSFMPMCALFIINLWLGQSGSWGMWMTDCNQGKGPSMHTSDMLNVAKVEFKARCKT